MYCTFHLSTPRDHLHTLALEGQPCPMGFCGHLFIATFLVPRIAPGTEHSRQIFVEQMNVFEVPVYGPERAHYKKDMLALSEVSQSTETLL